MHSGRLQLLLSHTQTMTAKHFPFNEEYKNAHKWMQKQ